MVSERPTPVVTAADTMDREHLVAAAFHSGEMEGLSPTKAARDDAAAYIAGVFDAEELAARARARYGLG